MHTMRLVYKVITRVSTSLVLISMSCILGCVYALTPQIDVRSPLDDARITLCRDMDALLEQASDAQREKLLYIQKVECPLVQSILDAEIPLVYQTPSATEAVESRISSQTVKILKSKKLTDARGTSFATLPAHISIREARGQAIDETGIVMRQRDVVSREHAGTLYNEKKSRQFQMGTPGKHLIFSAPVEISAVSDLPEGSNIDVMVFHAGDTQAGKVGLTANPHAVCLADGSVAKGDQLSTVRVKAGRVVFYTCGASLFTMNPVGGTVGSNDVKLLI
jgi:hypothetical protein